MMIEGVIIFHLGKKNSEKAAIRVLNWMVRDIVARPPSKVCDKNFVPYFFRIGLGDWNQLSKQV